MSYDFQPQNGGYGIDESSNGVHGEYPITTRNMDDMSQGKWCPNQMVSKGFGLILEFFFIQET